MSTSLGGGHEPTGPWLEDPRRLVNPEPTYCRQQWWAEQVGQARRAKLPALGTARDRTRLEAQEGALAHAWLTVQPSRNLGSTLADTDFRCLCRYWLGLPLLQDGMPSVCPACQEPCDPFGDHFVNCGKNGLTRRHNAVRDEWSRILAAAAVPHQTEVTCGDRKRPADILLIGWDRGRDICVDFTVTNPMSAENYPLQPGVGRSHLSAAEKAKTRIEGPLCAAVQWGLGGDGASGQMAIGGNNQEDHGGLAHVSPLGTCERGQARPVDDLGS
jgi:hypothetical protein